MTHFAAVNQYNVTGYM